MGWTYLAQNVVLYRAFGSTVVDRRFAMKAGNFLADGTSICFLCYMELLSDILYFASLVQVHNGISGRLFFFVLSQSQTNFKFYP